MDAELPDFYSLEDGLWRLDADFSAAEVHGIYCGVLSIDAGHDEVFLQNQVIGQIDEGPIDSHYQEVARGLTTLFQATQAQLNDGQLQFELLLPGEQESLEKRFTAMQKWCQGFAYGMALSGLKTMSDLPEDSREWVEDVIRIGSAGEYDLSDEDASEDALQELTEFLRVGVLMINEEVQPLRGVPGMEENE